MVKSFNPEKAEDNSKENDETQFFSTEEKDSSETVNSEMESVVIDPNQTTRAYTFEPEPEAEVNIESDITSVRTSPTTTERTMTPLRHSDDEDDKGRGFRNLRSRLILCIYFFDFLKEDR